MQIIVNNGPLSERELDAYIRQVTQKIPPSAIEKLCLDVHGDYVDVRYKLYRYRELRKMGGYCISEPETWNSAKRAEYREMVPNSFEEAD